MNPQEMVRVQNYLRKLFGAKTLSVRARPKIKDSAEVYVGEDFVGTLTVDNEDGELCYQFRWRSSSSTSKTDLPEPV